MIKARSRKLSLVLVLAMLMTMFAGLGTASAAAATYDCAQVPYVTANSTVSSSLSTLGTVLISWDVLLPGTHEAIIQLPGDFEFPEEPWQPATEEQPGNGAYYFATKTDDGAFNASGVLERLSKKEAKIKIVAPTTYNDVQIALFLDNISVGSPEAGEAKLQFRNISGLFPQDSVTIGNVTGGMAQISVVETKTIKGGPATAIEFTIQEDSANAVVEDNNTLKLKLPKGFEWRAPFRIALVSDLSTDLDSEFDIEPSSDNRILYIHRDKDNNQVPDKRSMFRLTASVWVDETEASFGDVMVNVSGATKVVPGEVKIGAFSDFGYTVEVDDPDKEIIAGRIGDEAELSTFTIKENIAGSILDGRTIYMELPAGVEWLIDESASEPRTPVLDVDNQKGDLTITDYQVVRGKPSLLKATVSNNPGTSKGEVDITAQVRVAVDYEGPVTVKLSGSAGIDEEITVAKVVKPLSGTNDSVEVIIGAQNQEAATIKITEIKAETLMNDTIIKYEYYGGDGESLVREIELPAVLEITAPAGVSFAKLPDVKVDGGLAIGTVTRALGPDGTRNNVIVIPIRSISDTAANIEISNLFFNVDRTVPEGDLVLRVGGTAVDRAQIPNRTTALEIVAAKVVTPAPGAEVGNGEFKIGSNIYYVGGVAKVMDVAPYIKNSRTYVPMRYLGDILGAEVVWDDAARTVTLTRGATTVVFTIGSTSYTVNGEAKTADVAPEIVNDRTMLPARFVAEAFGATVGWDPATQTVVIQK